MQAGVQADGVETWRAAPTLTLCARSGGSAAPADAAPQRSNIKGCRNRISYGIVPEDPKAEEKELILQRSTHVPIATQTSSQHVLARLTVWMPPTCAR
eukprot:6207175-Pleurochrysis_carterae.AAC.1